MMLLRVLLALAAFCLYTVAANPCATAPPPKIISPVASGKATEALRLLGGLKKKASASLRKVDHTFWPDMGVSMDPAVSQLIRQAKPLTKKRDSSDSEVVEVEIKVANVTDKLLRFISTWGTVIFSSTKYNVIDATLPVSRLAAVASFEGVIYVGPKGVPQTNQASNFPGVVSHRADLVQNLGYLGQGVKVGVLSDSVDLIGIAQSQGRLPNVTVLRGSQGWGVSEGVALLEIIHQVAPSAELYFATAFGSDAAYAHNILNLAALGCKVIIDNVFYFQEPVFEDGIIAQAVNEVVKDGVIYITAAGNQGNTFFHTASTYEGDYNPTPWTIFAQSFSSYYQDIHLFTPTQAFNKASGVTRFITLHWSDPFFEAYADYDLFVFDAAGDLVSFSASSALAFEICQTWFLPPGDYFIVVARYSGPSRFISLRSYDATLQVNTNGFIFGHAASNGALAIGAILQDSPDNYFNQKSVAGFIVPEAFTSDGPRKIYYENGLNVSPDLSSTGGLTRMKPDFIAADGVPTVTPGFQNYYGSSCSAAHAAGIAALAVSAFPGLTPAQFKAAAIVTAVDALTPGFDVVTGYGALDTLPLIQNLLQ